MLNSGAKNIVAIGGLPGSSVAEGRQTGLNDALKAHPDARLVQYIGAGEGGSTEAFRFDEDGDDIWQSEVSYYSQAHTNQIHEFVEALKAGKKPRYTGEDGYRDIKTTMAAICSAKEGLPVKVAEITDKRFNA